MCSQVRSCGSRFAGNPGALFVNVRACAAGVGSEHLPPAPTASPSSLGAAPVRLLCLGLLDRPHSHKDSRAPGFARIIPGLDLLAAGLGSMFCSTSL